MKKQSIKISSSLTLPAELAARTQAILAMKGVGKTYVAMKETEELLKLKQQVVCLDPTGVWYGLRSSANGKSEGFPILIFGGDSADVPLEPTAGEYLADFVQDSGRSVIFDMSHFESQASQDRFVTDFATRLYRRKAKKEDRNTIHLMLDEADSFAPQRPAKNQLKMLGAWEAIVRRGRSRGIGLTMITQRPAVINKNVLTQVDLLVCLRIVGIQDFKAMKEWTDLYATPDQKKDFMESLPKLETGQAWFWSPGWLRIFLKTQVDPKITFDSSRTPEPGERAKTPRKVAQVDLHDLTEQIKATVEQAKQNDPSALKKRIRELEAKQTPVVSQPKKEQIKFVTKEVKLVSESQLKKLEVLADNLLQKGATLFGDIQTAIAAVNKSNAEISKSALTTISIPIKGTTRIQAVALSAPQKATLRYTTDGSVPSTNGEFRMTPRYQALINALAFYDTIGLSQIPKSRHAAFVGRPADSSYRNDLAAMRTAGILDYPTPGDVNLTANGKQLVTEVPNVNQNDDLHQIWLNRLIPRYQSILQKLIAIHPNSEHKESVAGSLGRPADSSFRNDLSAMRTLGIIDYPQKGMVIASPNLFPLPS